MISLRDFSFTYDGSPQPALSKVNLEIAAGEFVVIAGPSGCGKTTLALAIAGVLCQQYNCKTDGKISVQGADVLRAPVYETAQRVGLVQQNPELQFCTLTVLDEVAFGLENRCVPREIIEQRVIEALERVNALHLLGRELASLSGGEKQRVAIASVIATQPPVLIFDEPTSNLDPAATRTIFRVVEGIREQGELTVIVIEHKLAFLRPFFPRLIELEHGRIVADETMSLQPLTAPLTTGRCSPQTTSKEPIVTVQDLCVQIDGREILSDISLEIHAGDVISVMGRNGSGKTTFLQCLIGLVRTKRGMVFVAGHDASETPVSTLARAAGYVFQNPDHQLFANSVWEEATLAPKNFGAFDASTDKRTVTLLERAGLMERVEDHPYRLSFGQKRRLNMVSILSYQPVVLLLDEILIGQDPANARFLLDNLCGAAGEGAAVLLVNHHPDLTTEYANRILFLEEGRLRVDAPISEGLGQLARLGYHAFLPYAMHPSPPSETQG